MHALEQIPCGVRLPVALGCNVLGNATYGVRFAGTFLEGVLSGMHAHNRKVT